jgi:Cu2+-exporting ATPase
MPDMPPDAMQANDSNPVEYSVVHRNQNRIRFRIPQLAVKAYSEPLERVVRSLVFVVQVRLNIAARSLVVEFDGTAIDPDFAFAQLVACIQATKVPSSPVPPLEEREVDDIPLVIPTVGYQIVHRNEYRLRLCIPRLGDDPEYIQRVKQLATALPQVKEVWINQGARSIAVEFTRPLSGSNLEKVLLQVIQRAADRNLEQVHPQPHESPATPTPQQNWEEYLERLGLPALSLALGVGAWAGVPIPGLVTAGVLFLAARPLFQRALQSLREDQKLTIDFLDGLALSLHTLQGNYFAPALMLGLVEGGELIRDHTARRSSRASCDLMDCLELDAIVERNGQEQRIPVQDIQVGDWVRVYPGDQILVDGKILRGQGLIDQCSLTGESVPVERAIGDEVFASTLVIDGCLCIATERTGKDTHAGMIAGLMRSAPVHDTRVGNYAAMVANQLVVPSLVAAAAVGLVSGDVNRTISLLTLDLGTGIRISVPTTIMSALTCAARSGIFIRSGRALEVLAQVDTIVFDKTGTLTQGQAGVTGIELIAGVDELEFWALVATAEQGLTHPVAEAITRHVKTLGIPLGTCETWDYRVGLGVVATIDGRSLLVGSRRLMVEAEVHLAGLPIYPSGSESLIYVARDGQLLGTICYRDPLRLESGTVIQTLHDLGIESYMLSGDAERVAVAVAQEVGINPHRVYAEAFPEEKVEVVQKLRSSGRQVAFCGDGINDSAALAYADVSISFAGATDIARETADIVLMKNDLQSLVQAVHTAREAMEIIQQNIAIVGIPNVGAIVAGILFVIDPMLAILINNGSAILAELNALRPLLNSTQDNHLQTEIHGGARPSEPVQLSTRLDKNGNNAAIALTTLPSPPTGNSPCKTKRLRQSELARRFGVSPQVLSRRRSRSEFTEWSRTQDPEGRAWRYDASAKRFEPIDGSNSETTETIAIHPRDGSHHFPHRMDKGSDRSIPIPTTSAPTPHPQTPDYPQLTRVAYASPNAGSRG